MRLQVQERAQAAAEAAGRRWGRVCSRAVVVGTRRAGNNGSATVQGTIWRTEDLCNGATRFTLIEGRLKIRDFDSGNIVILRPKPNGDPGVYVARVR